MSATVGEPDPLSLYEQLVEEGTRQSRRGEFRDSLETFERTRRIAIALDDQTLLFRAICNISGVRLSLGDPAEAERGLREILLKTLDPNIVFWASSNLASALRQQGRLAKAMLYAKKALRASEAIKNVAWKAMCHNRIANIYLNMSYPDDAMSEYKYALRLSSEGHISTSYEVDYIRENLGYCLLLKKRYRQGIALILKALKIAQANENVRCVGECYQDLSFGYMQLKELDHAQDYGERALSIASAQGYKDLLKNCYYLLGEIHLLKDEDERSDHYFGKLQELYPHLPVLRDFLRTFDVSNIVNFKNPF